MNSNPFKHKYSVTPINGDETPRGSASCEALAWDMAEKYSDITNTAFVIVGSQGKILGICDVSAHPNKLLPRR